MYNCGSTAFPLEHQARETSGLPFHFCTTGFRVYRAQSVLTSVLCSPLCDPKSPEKPPSQMMARMLTFQNPRSQSTGWRMLKVSQSKANMKLKSASETYLKNPKTTPYASSSAFPVHTKGPASPPLRLASRCWGGARQCRVAPVIVRATRRAHDHTSATTNNNSDDDNQTTKLHQKHQQCDYHANITISITRFALILSHHFIIITIVTGHHRHHHLPSLLMASMQTST